MSIPLSQHTHCEQSAGSSIVCCPGPWEQGEPLGSTALEEPAHLLVFRARDHASVSQNVASCILWGEDIMKTLESCASNST